jgi:hypothetical protein
MSRDDVCEERMNEKVTVMLVTPWFLLICMLFPVEGSILRRVAMEESQTRIQSMMARLGIAMAAEILDSRVDRMEVNGK